VEKQPRHISDISIEYGGGYETGPQRRITGARPRRRRILRDRHGGGRAV